MNMDAFSNVGTPKSSKSFERIEPHGLGPATFQSPATCAARQKSWMWWALQGTLCEQHPSAAGTKVAAVDGIFQPRSEHLSRHGQTWWMQTWSSAAKMVGLLMMNQDHAEAKVTIFEGLNLVETPRKTNLEVGLTHQQSDFYYSLFICLKHMFLKGLIRFEKINKSSQIVRNKQYEIPPNERLVFFLHFCSNVGYTYIYIYYTHVCNYGAMFSRFPC